jgi:hypothetical protein
MRLAVHRLDGRLAVHRFIAATACGKQAQGDGGER